MAKLSWPDGLAIDRNDVLYFTENGNNTIRKITPDGIISPVAGSPGIRSYDPGRILAGPRGLSFDSSGVLYVAEADIKHGRISRIRSDGSVEVIAGAPSAFDVAKGDGGRAMDATIPYPTAVAFDASGNLFIASDRIRRVDKNGLITSVIGAAEDATPLEDGSPLQTRLGSPQAMAFDQTGSLYIADTFRNRVLRFDTTGKLEVVAGLSVLLDEKDGGPAEFAHLSSPWAVAIGPRGDLFVADTEMNRICLITTEGRFYRVAGKGVPYIRIEGIELTPGPHFTGDGGSAKLADIDGPTGVAIDVHGNIYMSDSNNNRVRKVTPDGIIQTIAGTGESGFGGDGGPATRAKLSHPTGLAVDLTGNLYIAENNRVRQVTPDGRIKTVVGSGTQGDSADGAALSVKLNSPHGVAVDREGTLYIADTFNHRIRKLGKDGVVRSIAGTGKPEFNGDDGPAISAGLAAPDSIAVDEEGNIFIADRANWRVRKIATDGTIHTIAGNHETGFYGDGGPALKAPIFPTSVAVDAHGRVYVTHNNTIRVLTPATN
jgi:sugar lactone lactonase YvrE